MNALQLFADKKLEIGYAETSTRKHPREPETVIVGETEQASCRCVGHVRIDGDIGWLAFKVKGQRRYYFQRRPW